MNAKAITFDVRMLSSRFFSFAKFPSPAGLDQRNARTITSLPHRRYFWREVWL